MSQHFLKYCLSFAVILWICSCGKTPEQLKSEREKVAEEGKGEVVIGVVWTSSDGSLVKGVQQAVDEINYEGGLLGRKIKIDLRVIEETLVSSLDDQTLIRKVRDTARNLSAQTNLIAVIGHRATAYVIPASIIYQEHGVLFFPPAATGLMFTRHNFNYVFRVIPNNRKLANFLAAHSYQMGYRNMAVFNNRSYYGEELASSFVEGAVDHGIEIVHRRSFFDNRTDFSQLISEFKKKEHVAAIFLAAGTDDGGRFINQSRRMGVKIPIIAGDALGTQHLIDAVGEKGEGLIIPTVFSEKTKESLPFVEKFHERYGQKVEPDHLAAGGYDALQLIAHAVRNTESLSPLKIATFLRYMPSWSGVGGSFKFEESGELEDKRIYLKILCKGVFHALPLETAKLVSLDPRSLPGKESRQCLELFKELIFSDQDLDGIPDKNDICPLSVPEDLKKGIYTSGARVGCPIDSDNDGIPDYRDQCPNTEEAELDKVDENGCPQDLDQDGVPDHQDSCLETAPGVEVDSRGCGVTEVAPQILTIEGKHFVKDSARLQSQAETVLSSLVEKLIKMSPYIKTIEIIGYTNTRNSPEKNKALSKQQAATVAKYFTDHGLSLPADKISVSGRGDEQPLDSNSARVVLAKNQRVEIKVTLLKRKIEPISLPPSGSP